MTNLSPITERELHAYLYRIYVLAGPVSVRQNQHGDLMGFTCSYQFPNEEGLLQYQSGAKGDNLSDESLRLLCRIIYLVATRTYEWHDFYPPRPGMDPKVEAHRVLKNFVDRFSVMRANNNPLRNGSVDITLQPTGIGKTNYYVNFGDGLIIPGYVQGDENAALRSAKEAIRRHATALGEFL